MFPIECLANAEISTWSSNLDCGHDSFEIVSGIYLKT